VLIKERCKSKFASQEKDGKEERYPRYRHEDLVGTGLGGNWQVTKRTALTFSFHSVAVVVFVVVVAVVADLYLSFVIHVRSRRVICSALGAQLFLLG